MPRPGLLPPVTGPYQIGIEANARVFECLTVADQATAGGWEVFGRPVDEPDPRVPGVDQRLGCHTWMSAIR